jgi:hypothetical protein
MFPHITTLNRLSERPEGIIATGRMGGYGPWMVTEFRDSEGRLVYKHQKFDWTKRGDVFTERWYGESAEV